MISSLQHFLYCPRQCALIHIDQVFEENLFTLRGRRAHEAVDDGRERTRDGARVLSAVPLWSDRLGIVGKADSVEILADGVPFPVEHKVGRRVTREADDVQLCAQGMCLEEMTGSPIPGGAIYHFSSRRRRAVAFTPELRRRTEETIQSVRVLLRQSSLPPPVADSRCPPCSLIDTCMPHAVQQLSLRRGTHAP